MKSSQNRLLTELNNVVNQSAGVHPTAIISSGAVLGSGTTVGPYSIIGPNVVLGDENVIGPHVVLDGHTKIGNRNRIFQFASVGAPPQDLKYRGEASELIIGDGNIIREGATLQPGTQGGGMKTTVGNQNLLMAYAHLGHDCHVGSRCVFANSVAVAGHVTIGDGVILGGLSGIHQFVRLGSLSMLGAGTMVAQDIPPFCIAQGDRAKLVGINRIGMERAGVQKPDIAIVRKIYRSIFMAADGLTMARRMENAAATAGDSESAKLFVEFIASAARGVPRHRGSAGAESDD